jgi:competence protein ComEA
MKKTWFSILLMAATPVLGLSAPLCVSSVAQARQLLSTDNPFAGTSTAAPAAQPPAATSVPAAQSATGSGSGGDSVNINTADAATLSRQLVGIGPAKAAAIVQHRQQHGPFRTLADLDAVKGIGPATLQKNQSRIRFQ